MSMKLSSLLAALVCVTLSGTSHAALQGRDLNGSIDSFEAYYDTDLHITWLANAVASGSINLPTAKTWVADLSFTDGVNVYDNWRLPALDPADGVSFDERLGGRDIGEYIGANTVYGGPRNELAYMFYTNLQRLSYAGYTGNTPNYNAYIPFSGVGFTYWSGNNDGYAFTFRFEGVGYQGTAHPYADWYYAWAVSDGDVGIAAVPEVSTYAMMLAGLVLVGVAARRRRV